MAFVYMLRCNDNTIYTGYTTDPVRRVKQHNMGKGARYTRARLPAVLVYLEEVPDAALARRREYAIKKLTRENKEKLIAAYALCGSNGCSKP